MPTPLHEKPAPAVDGMKSEKKSKWDKFKDSAKAGWNKFKEGAGKVWSYVRGGAKSLANAFAPGSGGLIDVGEKLLGYDEDKYK